jgi:type VI protein secretion system component Hcp
MRRTQNIHPSASMIESLEGRAMMSATAYSAPAPTAPTESLSLNFTKIEYKYSSMTSSTPTNPGATNGIIAILIGL